MADGVGGLVAFLRARLEDDEGVARFTQHPAGSHTLEWDVDGHRTVQYKNGRSENYVAVRCGDWDRILVAADRVIGDVSGHIARWDPLRVLVEVDAKRRILDEHTCTCPDPDCGDCGACSGGHHADPTPAPCQTVRLLALPYESHPEFDPSWRPQ